MYPKCGCPTECRVCNALAAKRDAKQTTQIRAVLVFSKGITSKTVDEMIKALGKDVAQMTECKPFVPAARPSTPATSQPAHARGE